MHTETHSVLLTNTTPNQAHTHTHINRETHGSNDVAKWWYRNDSSCV